MSLTRPNVIGNPFAYNGDYILPPTDGSNTDAIVSQEVGYPQTQSAPLGSGGIPINRQQTNGIYNLYTNTLVWLNAGGTFTFDDTIVTTQGGYSQGAVLWCESISGFLVSLIDNNAANFVTNPNYINDGINWQTVTGIQSDFNVKNNIGNASSYNISLVDGFSIIENDNTSISYVLPDPRTVPEGFTVCITNQFGTITDGTNSVIMTNQNSNRYFKCEKNSDLWVIDNQPIATYSQWATQAYAKTQRYFSLLITSNTTWICPANVTQIYVTLIGGGGSGAVGGGSGGGGGGGTGYLLFKQPVLVTPGTSYPITIGAGGIISTGAGNNGSPTTAFGLTANGGFGGVTTGAGGFGGSTGASGGTGTGGQVGGGGGSIWIAGGGTGGTGGGGSAVFNGGGGGGTVLGISGAGGRGAVLIEY
jgi:hypothetical protein